MKLRTLALTSTALAFLVTGATSFAADPEKTQTQSQTKKQTKIQEQVSDNAPVFGWELMTVKERNAHREKMRLLKTQSARTAYLEKHHKMMEERAKERGVNLREQPMMGGQGARAGSNSGGGGGAGGGAGPRR